MPINDSIPTIGWGGTEDPNGQYQLGTMDDRLQKQYIPYKPLRKVNFDFRWPKWENVWMTVGLAVVLVAGTLLLNVVTATHKVNHYYIGGSLYSTACVYAQVDWDEDPKIFCSDDIGKVVLVVDGANRVLQGR